MNKKPSTICGEHYITTLERDNDKLQRRNHTLQVQIELLRGALKGFTEGLFRLEDK